MPQDVVGGGAKHIPPLRDLIAHRTDLSTFIVHLTREYEGSSARENLVQILDGWRIKARNPLGCAVPKLDVDERATENDLASQRCVSFTETPLEHLRLMISDITDARRNCEFGPYGVAFTKRVARKRGINPVWYIDVTPGRPSLLHHLLTLVDKALDTGAFLNSDIARITPFIETMAMENPDGKFKKEFWWEREWRMNGDVVLPPLVIGIAPEWEHEELVAGLEAKGLEEWPFIDPHWGLERIIAHLAGFSADDVYTIGL